MLKIKIMGPFSYGDKQYKQFELYDMDIDEYNAFPDDIKALNLKVLKGRDKLLKTIKSPKIKADIQPNDEIEQERKVLSKLKMKELRKIGSQYNVNDTSKKELINEILNEKYGGK